MVRATMGRFWMWLKDKAYPAVAATSDDWWNDMGDNPRSHLLSMAAGAVLALALVVAL